jgi:hypothetical protein
MKRIFLIGLVLVIFIMPEGNCQRSRDKVKIKPDSLKVDSVEYKLIVFDPGFDSWIATKPQMNFYSKEYYETKNRLYVTEWNYRNQQPLTFGDLYDSKIEYYFNVDYGIELNYRLYYYFRFFEETNHISLINQVH